MEAVVTAMTNGNGYGVDGGCHRFNVDGGCYRFWDGVDGGCDRFLLI